MKKITKTKLGLQKETVRNLAKTELAAVQGALAAFSNTACVWCESYIICSGQSRLDC